MVSISTSIIVDIDNISEAQFPVNVCYNTVDNYGWINGHIEIPPHVGQYSSCNYEFEAKVYDKPSHLGIDGGCISKLYVKDMYNDTEVIGYDRGWYLEPHYPQEYAALNALLEIFDTPK